MIKLNNGYEIPLIGNGPAGVGYSPKPKRKKSLISKIYFKIIGKKIQENIYIKAVTNSLNIGFVLLDNSASYCNEKLICKAIKRSKLNRKDIFITTRVSNKAQLNRTVRKEFFQSLKDLETDYIDLYQFHWPVTDCYLDTWLEMVKLYKEGYCKSIGIANCNQKHIEEILKISEFVPAINQIEIHPLFTQKELISFCKSKKIVVQAYTPIARYDDRLFNLPLLDSFSKKYNKSKVQIVLRWHIQNEIIPIVRSLNKKRQRENYELFDFKLTEQEMHEIDKININSRLRYDSENCDFSIL